MRACVLVMVLLALETLTGCAEQQAANETAGNLDVELVNAVNSIGVENAIIAQHTIYPYHFTADAETLNELGQRDLAVLANHFKEHTGTLNVHRGSEPGSLYEARVAHVVAELKAAGVKTDRMVVSDGIPGGAGISSERLITVLDDEPESRITNGSKAVGTVSR